MRKVFSDPNLDQEFKTKGYVVIPGFLKQDEVQRLQLYYDEQCQGKGVNRGFHATSHVSEIEYKKEVSDVISQVFNPNSTNLLHNFRSLYGAYTIKETGTDSGVRSHMDWSFVDEETCVSLSIWTPLVNTNSNNGHLWVMEGSHLMDKTYRGGPWNYTGTTTPYSILKERKFKKVELFMNAGDAVFYDHRTFHGSAPNLSSNRRVAINLTMLPAEVKSRHYHLREDETVECFEVEDDFYVNIELGTFPETAKSLGILPEKIHILQQEEIDSLAIEPECGRATINTRFIRESFIDKVLQNEFERYGFVKLPLLNEEDLAKLMDVYMQFPAPDLETTFYTTHWSHDDQHRLNIDKAIRPVLQNRVLPYLSDYKACAGIFLVKRPGDDGEFHVHQDWTLVEETIYRGITIWVALCDTNVENGCLHVVPGSHLYCNNIRGANIEPPIHQIKPMIESEFCIPIPMKAGEAIFFDHRLLHYSPPNQSETNRISVGLVVIPKETTFIHYHRENEEDDFVSKYIADDNFLLEMALGQLDNRNYFREKKFEYWPEFHTEESFKDASKAHQRKT